MASLISISDANRAGSALADMNDLRCWRMRGFNLSSGGRPAMSILPCLLTSVGVLVLVFSLLADPAVACGWPHLKIDSRIASLYTGVQGGGYLVLLLMLFSARPFSWYMPERTAPAFVFLIWAATAFLLVITILTVGLFLLDPAASQSPIDRAAGFPWIAEPIWLAILVTLVTGIRWLYSKPKLPERFLAIYLIYLGVFLFYYIWLFSLTGSLRVPVEVVDPWSAVRNFH